MKDLNLTRTIPLLGLGAFALVGCGGRSIDDGSGSGSSEQLSDENFEDTLLDSLEDLCVRNERCGYSDYGDPGECAEYLVEGFEQTFDLESRACRRLAIEAIDCLAGQPRCDEGAYASCEDEIYEFGARCADYSYDYYDY